MSKDITFRVATLDDQAEPVEPPNISVHIYNEDGCGIRVLLGDSEKNSICPDLLIERCMEGWRVIVHPGEGRDPVCAVLIRSDHEVFVVEGDAGSVRVAENEKVAWTHPKEE